MYVTMLVTSISEQVKAMYGEINVMYDAIKFIYSSFFTVIGLLIALAGLVTYATLRKLLNKFIAKERSKLTSNMLEELANTKQVMGKEFLGEHKYMDGHYVFPVLSHRISFTPNLINKILLMPLEGDKELEYKAWVKKGQLYIEFMNYDEDKDKGIRWIIIYNSKY